MECQALLKNSDRQCSRKAEPGSIYCWQHKKIYESKEQETTNTKNIQPNNISTTKFSPALINDINNIIYDYAYFEFDPVESLKYSELNPKKYPYSQYLTDFEIYKKEKFEELKVYIILKFPDFTTLYNNYINNTFDLTKDWINLYKWGYDMIKYVIDEFKILNLDVPIEELLSSSPSDLANGAIEVKLKKKDQLYNKSSKYVYLSMGAMGLNSNIIPVSTTIHYIDLSYFWKLIFIIIFDI